MDLIVKFLFLSGQYVTCAAGKTIFELINQSAKIQRHVFCKYEQLTQMVGPYDNMLELCNACLQDSSMTELIYPEESCSGSICNTALFDAYISGRSSVNPLAEDAFTPEEICAMRVKDKEYEQIFQDLCEDMRKSSLELKSEMNSKHPEVSSEIHDVAPTNLQDTESKPTASSDELLGLEYVRKFFTVDTEPTKYSLMATESCINRNRFDSVPFQYEKLLHFQPTSSTKTTASWERFERSTIQKVLSGSSDVDITTQQSLATAPVSNTTSSEISALNRQVDEKSDTIYVLSTTPAKVLDKQDQSDIKYFQKLADGQSTESINSRALSTETIAKFEETVVKKLLKDGPKENVESEAIQKDCFEHLFSSEEAELVTNTLRASRSATCIKHVNVEVDLYQKLLSDEHHSRPITPLAPLQKQKFVKKYFYCNCVDDCCAYLANLGLVPLCDKYTYMNDLICLAPDNSYFKKHAYAQQVHDSILLHPSTALYNLKKVLLSHEVTELNNKAIVTDLRKEIQCRTFSMKKMCEHCMEIERNVMKKMVKSDFIGRQVKTNLNEKLHRNMYQIISREMSSCATYKVEDNKKNDLDNSIQLESNLIKINQIAFSKLEQKVTQILLEQSLKDIAKTFCKKNYIAREKRDRSKRFEFDEMNSSISLRIRNTIIKSVNKRKTMQDFAAKIKRRVVSFNQDKAHAENDLPEEGGLKMSIKLKPRTVADVTFSEKVVVSSENQLSGEKENLLKENWSQISTKPRQLNTASSRAKLNLFAPFSTYDQNKKSKNNNIGNSSKDGTNSIEASTNEGAISKDKNSSVATTNENVILTQSNTDLKRNLWSKADLTSQNVEVGKERTNIMKMNEKASNMFENKLKKSNLTTKTSLTDYDKENIREKAEIIESNAKAFKIFEENLKNVVILEKTNKTNLLKESKQKEINSNKQQLETKKKSERRIQSDFIIKNDFTSTSKADAIKNDCGSHNAENKIGKNPFIKYIAERTKRAKESLISFGEDKNKELRLRSSDQLREFCRNDKIVSDFIVEDKKTDPDCTSKKVNASHANIKSDFIVRPKEDINKNIEPKVDLKDDSVNIKNTANKDLKLDIIFQSEKTDAQDRTKVEQNTITNKRDSLPNNQTVKKDIGKFAKISKSEIVSGTSDMKYFAKSAFNSDDSKDDKDKENEKRKKQENAALKKLEDNYALWKNVQTESNTMGNYYLSKKSENNIQSRNKKDTSPTLKEALENLNDELYMKSQDDNDSTISDLVVRLMDKPFTKVSLEPDILDTNEMHSVLEAESQCGIHDCIYTKMNYDAKNIRKVESNQILDVKKELGVIKSRLESIDYLSFINNLDVSSKDGKVYEYSISKTAKQNPPTPKAISDTHINFQTEKKKKVHINIFMSKSNIRSNAPKMSDNQATGFTKTLNTSQMTRKSLSSKSFLNTADTYNRGCNSTNKFNSSRSSSDLKSPFNDSRVLNREKPSSAKSVSSYVDCVDKQRLKIDEERVFTVSKTTSTKSGENKLLKIRQSLRDAKSMGTSEAPLDCNLNIRNSTTVFSILNQNTETKDKEVATNEKIKPRTLSQMFKFKFPWSERQEAKNVTSNGNKGLSRSELTIGRFKEDAENIKNVNFKPTTSHVQVKHDNKVTTSHDLYLVHSKRNIDNAGSKSISYVQQDDSAGRRDLEPKVPEVINISHEMSHSPQGSEDDKAVVQKGNLKIKYGNKEIENVTYNDSNPKSSSMLNRLSANATAFIKTFKNSPKEATSEDARIEVEFCGVSNENASLGKALPMPLKKILNGGGEQSNVLFSGANNSQKDEVLNGDQLYQKVSGFTVGNKSNSYNSPGQVRTKSDSSKMDDTQTATDRVQNKNSSKSRELQDKMNRSANLKDTKSEDKKTTMKASNLNSENYGTLRNGITSMENDKMRKNVQVHANGHTKEDELEQELLAYYRDENEKIFAQNPQVPDSSENNNLSKVIVKDKERLKYKKEEAPSGKVSQSLGTVFGCKNASNSDREKYVTPTQTNKSVNKTQIVKSQKTVPQPKLLLSKKANDKSKGDNIAKRQEQDIPDAQEETDPRKEGFSFKKYLEEYQKQRHKETKDGTKPGKLFSKLDEANKVEDEDNIEREINAEIKEDPVYKNLQLLMEREGLQEANVSNVNIKNNQSLREVFPKSNHLNKKDENTREIRSHVPYDRTLDEIQEEEFEPMKRRMSAIITKNIRTQRNDSGKIKNIIDAKTSESDKYRNSIELVTKSTKSSKSKGTADLVAKCDGSFASKSNVDFISKRAGELTTKREVELSAKIIEDQQSKSKPGIQANNTDFRPKNTAAGSVLHKTIDSRSKNNVDLKAKSSVNVGSKNTDNFAVKSNGTIKTKDITIVAPNRDNTKLKDKKTEFILHEIIKEQEARAQEQQSLPCQQDSIKLRLGKDTETNEGKQQTPIKHGVKRSVSVDFRGDNLSYSRPPQSSNPETTRLKQRSMTRRKSATNLDGVSKTLEIEDESRGVSIKVDISEPRMKKISFEFKPLNPNGLMSSRGNNSSDHNSEPSTDNSKPKGKRSYTTILNTNDEIGSKVKGAQGELEDHSEESKKKLSGEHKPEYNKLETKAVTKEEHKQMQKIGEKSLENNPSKNLRSEKGKFCGDNEIHKNDIPFGINLINKVQMVTLRKENSNTKLQNLEAKHVPFRRPVDNFSQEAHEEPNKTEKSSPCSVENSAQFSASTSTKSSGNKSLQKFSQRPVENTATGLVQHSTEKPARNSFGGPQQRSPEKQSQDLTKLKSKSHLHRQPEKDGRAKENIFPKAGMQQQGRINFRSEKDSVCLEDRLEQDNFSDLNLVKQKQNVSSKKNVRIKVNHNLFPKLEIEDQETAPSTEKCVAADNKKSQSREGRQYRKEEYHEGNFQKKINNWNQLQKYSEQNIVQKWEDKVSSPIASSTVKQSILQKLGEQKLSQNAKDSHLAYKVQHQRHVKKSEENKSMLQKLTDSSPIISKFVIRQGTTKSTRQPEQLLNTNQNFKAAQQNNLDTSQTSKEYKRDLKKQLLKSNEKNVQTLQEQFIQRSVPADEALLQKAVAKSVSAQRSDLSRMKQRIAKPLAVNNYADYMGRSHKTEIFKQDQQYENVPNTIQEKVTINPLSPRQTSFAFKPLIPTDYNSKSHGIEVNLQEPPILTEDQRKENMKAERLNEIKQKRDIIRLQQLKMLEQYEKARQKSYDQHLGQTRPAYKYVEYSNKSVLVKDKSQKVAQKPDSLQFSRPQNLKLATEIKPPSDDDKPAVRKTAVKTRLNEHFPKIERDLKDYKLSSDEIRRLKDVASQAVTKRQPSTKTGNTCKKINHNTKDQFMLEFKKPMELYEKRLEVPKSPKRRKDELPRLGDQKWQMPATNLPREITPHVEMSTSATRHNYDASLEDYEIEKSPPTPKVVYSFDDRSYRKILKNDEIQKMRMDYWKRLRKDDKWNPEPTDPTIINEIYRKEVSLKVPEVKEKYQQDLRETQYTPMASFFDEDNENENQADVQRREKEDALKRAEKQKLEKIARRAKLEKRRIEEDLKQKYPNVSPLLRHYLYQKEKEARASKARSNSYKPSNFSFEVEDKYRSRIPKLTTANTRNFPFLQSKNTKHTITVNIPPQPSIYEKYPLLRKNYKEYETRKQAELEMEEKEKEFKEEMERIAEEERERVTKRRASYVRDSAVKFKTDAYMNKFSNMMKWKMKYMAHVEKLNTARKVEENRLFKKFPFLRKYRRINEVWFPPAVAGADFPQNFQFAKYNHNQSSIANQRNWHTGYGELDEQKRKKYVLKQEELMTTLGKTVKVTYLVEEPQNEDN